MPWCNEQLHLKDLKNSSLWWRNIVPLELDFTERKILVLKNLKEAVGANDSVRLWCDPWCVEIPFKFMFPEMFNVAETNFFMFVA